MGAGGTGGFFGGCLARAGLDVTFIARGRHLAAIRENGLRVDSDAQGQFVIHPARATDHPQEVGPVDLVLFCVKTWDTETAAELVRPMLTPETLVLPTLNGVEAVERLSQILGRRHVLGAVAHLEASITEPGVIRHASPKLQDLTFGEIDGRVTPRAQRVLATLEEGKFNVRLSRDISRDIWTKFLFICALSGVCALTRLPIGILRENLGTREVDEEAVEC